MSKYILSGMQYGDEGKGSFVDFLTYEHNVDCVVKYNGGSQASHTVKTPKGQLHKFSQLGSGMFNPECHTYIAENMVVNLDNLLFEIEVFSTLTGEDKFDIVRRMHVHEDCYLVTPYHKLMNRIRELSVSPDERRGTVGTGVSEVRKFLETPRLFDTSPLLGLKVKDVFNPHSCNPVTFRIKEMQEYVTTFYEEHKDAILRNVPEDMATSLRRDIDHLLMNRKQYIAVGADYATKFKSIRLLSDAIYNNYNEIAKNENIIYEGAQGLLIDQQYGIKPNITHLDTTNYFAVNLERYFMAAKRLSFGCSPYSAEQDEEEYSLQKTQQ